MTSNWLTLGTCVTILAPVLNKSVLPPHVPGAGFFGIPSLEVFSDPSYRVVSQYLDLQMAVLDSTSDLDLFVI